eukprot:gene24360-9973_t
MFSSKTFNEDANESMRSAENGIAHMENEYCHIPPFLDPSPSGLLLVCNAPPLVENGCVLPPGYRFEDLTTKFEQHKGLGSPVSSEIGPASSTAPPPISATSTSASGSARGGPVKEVQGPSLEVPEVTCMKNEPPPQEQGGKKGGLDGVEPLTSQKEAELLNQRLDSEFTSNEAGRPPQNTKSIERAIGEDWVSLYVLNRD